MEPIIEVADLTRAFGHHTVLDRVSIRFEKAKIHGVIGRNGSGKTMLFKCILGLMPFSQDAISVRGARMGRDFDVPPHVGMIIEGPGFLPNYSGYANLRYLALIRNAAGRPQIVQSLRDVGLDPANRKWVSKYSMGMRQRLCIAQALMEGPDILILDEPMNGLDNAGVREMRALFKSLRDRGKTILLASHNPLDIADLCDTVCEMDAGVLTRVR